MNKEQLVKKFTSRKFIFTAIADIASIVTLFVADAEFVQSIAGLVMAAVTIFYLWTEGKIDAASVKNLASAAAKVADELGAEDKIGDTIEKVGEIAGSLVEETPAAVSEPVANDETEEVVTNE